MNQSNSLKGQKKDKRDRTQFGSGDCFATEEEFEKEHNVSDFRKYDSIMDSAFRNNDARGFWQF